MLKLTKYVCLALWGIFILGLLIGGGVLWAISSGFIGEMPSIEELENPQSKYATIVYSADSVELGRFSRAKENRVFINYNELSPNLINALVATEDARFLDHSGIDMKALFRAIFKTVLLHQRSAGGGSTITQQLAKQVYTKEVASNIWERAMQKPIEWVIAVKLERLYTKEEIINMYLNHFDFCYNAVGIRSAARIYFDKLPSELDVDQSAMLVGMLQNPSLYNPIRRPEKTKNRRAVVLNQMLKTGYLTQAEYNDYKERPLLPQVDRDGNYKLAHSADHKEGMAPYLREYLRKIMRANKPNRSRYASWQDQQFYDDSLAWETNPLYGWCNKNKKPDGTHYDLTTDGLRIYTSINSHMQQYAEESLVEHLRDNLQPAFNKEKQDQPNAPYSRKLTDDDVKNSLRRAMRQSERYTLMKANGYSTEEIEKAFQKPIAMKIFSWAGEIDTIMSPWDSLRWQKQFLRAGFMCMDTLGYVKAYVGGPDFAFFQYDMVTAGRRQVGSTIKPLLYTLAMEEGRTPCDEELNTQPVLYDAIGRPWTPRDGGRQRIGEMVTLRWGLMRSNNWISARVMSRMTPEHFVDFLHSAGVRNRLDPVLSLCLGSCDISVEEMVTAYSGFPGRGMRSQPLYVVSICDNSGMELAHFTPVRKEVFSAEAYYKMLPILRDVVDYGTGARIRSRYGITAPMGGKTGTTNDNSDGWFMAFTPGLVGGTWVGGEERTIHFDRTAEGQGAAMALPIWAQFIKRVLADPTLPYSSSDTFYYPSGYNPCHVEGAFEHVEETPEVESSFFD
ncbi:MAG: transglycosylase domain-containing protein [Bacteroidales bacterium]|nr:transglycosylase domain-containing protein [Bacteroidales bacterium]